MPTPELSPSSPGLTTAQTPVPYHRTDCMTATAPRPRGGGGLSSSLTHLQVRAMLLWSAVTQTPGEETTCVTTQRQGGPRGSELSQSRVLSWSLLSLCTRPLPLCAGKAKGQPDRHLCSLPTPVTSGSDVVMAALSQGRWGHPSHTRAGRMQRPGGKARVKQRPVLGTQNPRKRHGPLPFTHASQ